MRGKPKGAKPAAKADKAKAKASTAKPRAASAKRKSSANGSKAQAQERLGQLDGLVLGYMKKHRGELPITPTKVARGIKRSSGAVGNCLGRLEKAEKVSLTGKKPRRYDLAGSASSK